MYLHCQFTVHITRAQLAVHGDNHAQKNRLYKAIDFDWKGAAVAYEHTM